MTHFTNYRCLYIDALKGFVGSEEFESVSDALAVEREMNLFDWRGMDGLGFEVWQGERLVYRHKPIQRA